MKLQFLVLTALLLLSFSKTAIANMDDDFPPPFDFEEESEVVAKKAPSEKPILLPVEPVKKMRSKPLIAKQKPVPLPKNIKKMTAKKKPASIKERQAQAFKKLSRTKTASK